MSKLISLTELAKAWHGESYADRNASRTAYTTYADEMDVTPYLHGVTSCAYCGRTTISDGVCVCGAITKGA